MDEQKATRHPLPGETIPGSMRRIGARHLVVTEPARVKLMDIGSLEMDLSRINQLIPQAEQQLAALRGQRTITEQRIAEFRAAAVQRVAGDPEVPMITPEQLTAQDAKLDAEIKAAEASASTVDVAAETLPSKR